MEMHSLGTLSGSGYVRLPRRTALICLADREGVVNCREYIIASARAIMMCGIYGRVEPITRAHMRCLDSHRTCLHFREFWPRRRRRFIVCVCAC